MSNTYEVIKAAADRHGVPVEALLTIGGIETGFSFSSSANNPVSSASGAFQFTDDTAREYGLVGAKRNDLAAQADAAARMAAKNSKALAATLGRAPTAGELYLAHQQGLSGAKALLSNPDSPAVDVLRQFHGRDATKVITQNGGNANMTASQFANRWVAHGNQLAARIPPGEMPTVATALSTVPMPRIAPAPMVPSIDMAQMRRTAVPSQLIPNTFARLPQSTRSLGDEIAVRPIPGGKQQAPLFDAAFDTRTGQMRLTRAPIDSQGIAVGRSSAPPPIPAQMSPQLAGRRNVTQASQQAATSEAGRLRSGIGQPPAARTVQSVQVARLPELPAPFFGTPLPRPRPNRTGVIASYSTKPRVTGMSYAGQDRVIPLPRPAAPTVARGTSSVLDNYAYNTATSGRLPSIPMPDVQNIHASGSTNFNPYGAPLPAPLDVPPRTPKHALPSPFQVAQGTGFRGPPTQVASAPVPFMRPKVAPIPFERPTAVGTDLSVVPPKVAPVPFSRPNFGIGGVDITPLPMTGIDMSLIRRYPIGSTAPIGSLPGTMWQSHTENPAIVRPKAGFRLPGLFGLAQMGLGAMGFRPQWPSMPPAGGPGSGAVFGGGFLSGGRKQTAAVQAQRDAGYSPSESYDRANRASVERAIAGAANPDQARRLNQSLGNI